MLFENIPRLQNEQNCYKNLPCKKVRSTSTFMPLALVFYNIYLADKGNTSFGTDCFPHQHSIFYPNELFYLSPYLCYILYMFVELIGACFCTYSVEGWRDSSAMQHLRGKPKIGGFCFHQFLIISFLWLGRDTHFLP